MNQEMRKHLIVLALAISTALSGAAEPPADLTGAAAANFKSALGNKVMLRGRLESGKDGQCLLGATPSNVVFYVVPDIPANGPFHYPEAWSRLEHQQVRITGELKFRSFNRSTAKGFGQMPPDYYYMVLQQTTIERDNPQAWTTADSWYHPPGDWMKFREVKRLPDTEVVEVAAEHLDAAISELRDVACTEISPSRASIICGKPIMAQPDYRLYLVRALFLNRDTGSFLVTQAGPDLLVEHGSLGRSEVPMKRDALVVRLQRKPERIYIACSMAE